MADSGYASLKLLDRCRGLADPITFITRLRLDAALYEPAPPRRPGQIGRPRLKGERLTNLSVVAQDPSTTWTPISVARWYGKEERTVEVVSATAVWHSTGLPAVPMRWVLIRDPQEEFETQALLCTDLGAQPERIISWFVRRWQMGKPPSERYGSAWASRRSGSGRRRRSGGPPRRCWPSSRWSRSSPTGKCHRQMAQGSGVVRRAAWYNKEHPTFIDALALVRKESWSHETFCGSLRENDTVKVPRDFMERLTDAVCYAA